MDIKEIEKKFDDANKNTLQILEKVIVFKNHMVDELNFVAKQAIESAKMEILLSELAGIPEDKLSKLAQKLKGNPAIEQMSGYQIVQENERIVMDNECSVCKGCVVESQNNNQNDKCEASDACENVISTNEKHLQTRRKWIALQKIKMDECELRIEVARLKQSGGKKSSADKEEVVEFEL